MSCHAIDLAGLARDRDQIWGEAVEQFRAGEQWHLTPDEERLAVGEQSARMMTDPWVDILRDWLTHTKTATFSVTNAMAVLQIPPERQNLTNMQRLNGALRVCGYVPERSGGMGKKEIRYERLLKAV